MDLIRTKLECPPTPARGEVRPRLAERAHDIGAHRVTMVHAPAGYGKTTLLTQWYQALRQHETFAAWLTLDACDRDPMATLAYVAASLGRGGLPFEPPLERVLGMPGELYGTVDSLMAVLINDLERFEQPVVLFLDDAHLLTGPACATLSRLIDHAPANVSFVLACRSVPGLHLARHRGHGQLLEFGLEDLRFTPEETRSFLARGGVELESGELAQLEERTEGWVTGVKLAGIALRRGGDRHELLANFRGGGRSVSDFFVEEALSGIAAPMREFLLRTSILDRLNVGLCDAVAHSGDARKMLVAIEEAGLFLCHLDDERYWLRYHHLFSEFLRRRLADEHPGLERELHNRASQWFWNSGLYVEAIEHTLRSGDIEGAAERLELRCQDMTYTGKFALVRKFTAQIPEAILARHPRILLTMAWLDTRGLKFESARGHLEAARARIAALEASGDLPASEIRPLRFLILHREMILSGAEDAPAQVERQCRRLLDDFPEERHPYLSGTIYAQLLYAQREQFNLADLERLHAEVQGVFGRSEFRFALIALQGSIGPSLHFAGRTDRARQALEEGLAEAIRTGGSHSALAALPACPLAEIIYEANDIDRAEALIEAALPHAGEFGLVDQLLPGYLTQARIRRLRGDQAGAYGSLEAANAIAIERRLDRLRDAVVAERARMLIQDGQVEQAASELAAAGFPATPEAALPRGDVLSRHEFRALAFGRLAHAEDRVPEALHVAKHWRSFCAARGALRSLTRWDILSAQLHYIAGDMRAAQRALRTAISHAAGCRMVRSFLDEGAIMRALLSSTYEADLEVLHPTDAFAAELLDAFNPGATRHAPEARTAPRVPARAPATSEGLYGKLSAKEREILALVSSGMRNREVAGKLGMTEGSIKWYMQQVYDKVGTRRRWQAVERARQFGLIS